MDTPIIGIIGGKGKMGNLFATFFKKNNIEVMISDIGTPLTNEQVSQRCDIVIVSVPIQNTTEVIEQILPLIKESGAIMDLTSVKAEPIKTMLKGKVEVLGIHPMFGNSNTINGQTVILCPTKKSGKWSNWMAKFLASKDIDLVKMTPQEHDKMMGIAQALIHFADIAFIDALRKLKIPVKALLKFTSKASSLKILLAARLIAQDPALYTHIQTDNSESKKAISTFSKSVGDLSKSVYKKDCNYLINEFKKSQKFLGNYKDLAYKESNLLIEQLKNKKKPEVEKQPNKDDLATLGPKNTFSSIAAQKISKKDQGIFYADTITQLFDLVENKSVKAALVPIENKFAGTVRETLDALFLRNVHILDEVKIPIHHCLIMLKASEKKDIKVVASHTQAIQQCSKFIKSNFKDAQLQAFPSTAAAVEKLVQTQDTSLAVIAPEIAGTNPLVSVYAKNIEDSRGNETSFYLIKKGSFLKPEANAKKTSIAIHFSEDKAGSLAQVFNDFAKEKVNLSRIESRPTKSKFGQYIFYIEFDGSLDDKNVIEAIKNVKKKTSELKVLGSY